MEGSAVHRALADERRRRLLEELRRSRGGLDAAELARRLGVHANTVRWHLGVLADAGLVESEPRRGARGRPRILYRPSRHVPTPRGADEHRLLASVLTGAVASLPGGPEGAEAAGAAWGRYLVRRPSPLERPTDETAVAEVASLLDQQGFEPETAGEEIRMRRCPFHDLAEANPDVVCAVHRGLISGALAELGSDLRVDRLDVFVRPDLCVAALARS